jgi:hypothetical protein
MAEDTLIVGLDFAEADAVKEWQAVNGGVMGPELPARLPQAFRGSEVGDLVGGDGTQSRGRSTKSYER